jgi:outer membrane protein OmpA-like peptidoglycan-associated protein
MKSRLYSGFALLALLAFSAPVYADNMHDVVHDRLSGTTVHTSNGECVRTGWINDHDECAPPPPVVVIEAPTPPPAPRPIIAQPTLSREDRTVYFGFNQAALTPEMQQRLNTLAVTLHSDTNVKGARIVGYADRIGSTSYNEQLSKRRAENVRGYLVDHGLVNTQVAETKWYGNTEPRTSCPNSMKRTDLIACLQKDRRVEVEIDYILNAPAQQ